MKEKNEKFMIHYEEIAEIFGCSKGKAYNIIRYLQARYMKETGLGREALVAGYVPREFFKKTYRC